MLPDLFIEPKAGRIVKTNDGLDAFVPNPLPPELQWDSQVADKLASASYSLGGISQLWNFLPTPQFVNLLSRPFIRREAVLSSKIEGTYTTLSGLYIFEAMQNKKVDLEAMQVLNLANAIEFGIQKIDSGEQLNLGLIKELLKILMNGVWHGPGAVGELRKEQNWIGPKGGTKLDAIFVPPPVPEMKKAIDDLAAYILSDDSLPALIKVALIHSQFEAIHPFTDGNGRIGRLLIILYLYQKKILIKPLLYISTYFERHHKRYNELLLKVCQQGVWKEWIEFFLEGVISQSRDAVQRINRLVNIQKEFQQQVREKKLTPTAGQLVDLIFEKPIIKVSETARLLKLTYPAVSKAFKQLTNIGLLEEVVESERKKYYIAQAIMKVFE